MDSTYKTKSGALNKARALQYCLEEDKNILGDDDWIVHLDEERELLLSRDASHGEVTCRCAAIVSDKGRCREIAPTQDRNNCSPKYSKKSGTHRA